MESHLNLALCGLETTQNQVKDQSQQIEQLKSILSDQSQQIERQSKQIASLTSTVQGLVQQVERSGKFLKKLWCCVEVGSKISWFYQLS